MPPHSPQDWIDRHFLTIVPPLALVGAVGGWIGSASANPLGYQIFSALCGSLGCYMWAIHLRKPAPAKWLLLGLVPALPQFYLLGWHRAAKSARQSQGPPSDCPRCGAYLSGATSCAHCEWQAMDFQGIEDRVCGARHRGRS